MENEEKKQTLIEALKDYGVQDMQLCMDMIDRFKLKEVHQLAEALKDYGIQDIQFCIAVIDKFKDKEDQKESDWLEQHYTDKNQSAFFREDAIYTDTIEALKEKLNAREYNALYRYCGSHNIKTIRALCDLSYKNIKCMRNVGTVSAVNIYNQIRNTYGIRLDGYDEFMRDWQKIEGTD